MHSVAAVHRIAFTVLPFDALMTALVWWKPVPNSADNSNTLPGSLLDRLVRVEGVYRSPRRRGVHWALARVTQSMLFQNDQSISSKSRSNNVLASCSSVARLRGVSNPVDSPTSFPPIPFVTVTFVDSAIHSASLLSNSSTNPSFAGGGSTVPLLWHAFHAATISSAAWRRLRSS